MSDGYIEYSLLFYQNGKNEVKNFTVFYEDQQPPWVSDDGHE